jgi:hypothetical protein
MRNLNYFIFVLIIIIMFNNCSNSNDSSNMASDCDKLEQELKNIKQEYTDLNERYKNTIAELYANKDELWLIKDKDFIIGLWSTSWPVSPDISEGFIFNSDNTFIYQNNYWIQFDISKFKFPITYYYGTFGKWKLEGNKLYVLPEKDIYQYFKSAQETPSGYWPKDPAYSIHESKYKDWKIIADIRSFRCRWVKSEDDYYAGVAEYPLGNPDIYTLNIIIFNDGNISNKIVPHVQFGKHQDDFQDKVNKFYSELFKKNQ